MLADLFNVDRLGSRQPHLLNAYLGALAWDGQIVRMNYFMFLSNYLLSVEECLCGLTDCFICSHFFSVLPLKVLPAAFNIVSNPEVSHCIRCRRFCCLPLPLSLPFFLPKPFFSISLFSLILALAFN